METNQEQNVYDYHNIANPDLKRLHRMWLIARNGYEKVTAAQGGLLLIGFTLGLRGIFGLFHWSDLVLLVLTAMIFMLLQRFATDVSGIFGLDVLTAKSGTALLMMMGRMGIYLRNGW